ncbi:MAG TPA: hypothetical protein VE596_04245 [Gaiellaceae bacterium]|jgi:hypothetical protein|nr:hypothetical protein [Gaiellaceae bacterium]
MDLTRVRNRTLVYFGIAEAEEVEFPQRISPFKSGLGVVVGAVVAGVLFGLVERDVTEGVVVGGIWLGLMTIRSALAHHRARQDKMSRTRS